MRGVHDIISGQLWWSRQVSPTCSASKPCGSDYIRMTSAVEETGTIGCVRCYLKSFTTCRLTFVLQHYSTFTFCPYFCSCWLSLTNGAIWAFVAPALFVIVVRKSEQVALIVWLCNMTYTMCSEHYYTGKKWNVVCMLSVVCLFWSSGEHWHSNIRHQDYISNQRGELQDSRRCQCSQVCFFVSLKKKVFLDPTTMFNSDRLFPSSKLMM